MSSGVEQSPGAVFKKVHFNNEILSNEISISQITVHKCFNKIASAKIVLIDGSAAARDFPLSNNEMFKPGKSVHIELGFSDSPDTIFKGIIIKHSIKAKSQGPSLLTIEAKDEAIKLTANRKSVYHVNSTDSVAISEAAGSISTKEIQKTDYEHKQLVQYNSTDWDFIMTRAEANGMFVLTDDGKLIVKQPELSGNPIHTCTYGDNIWEFEADMDARKLFQSVESHAWDHTNQQLLESQPGTFDFQENGNIPSDELGAVLGGEIQLNHIGNLEQEELQNWSDAHMMKQKLSKTNGRVRIIGNAAIKPGVKIRLQGVGDRFNGDVFVTGVLHHYEGFWQTDIQFGWKEDWFYKKEDVMDKPASGLLPGVNGIHIGTVISVADNGDDCQYRIQVHIPLITSTNEGIWARVATLDAGANRGSYFRPEDNDEVVLGFLNDDPRDPIVLGYLHSKDTKSSPLPEDDNTLQSGFVTKEGLKLIFDDTNKKLTLSTPGSPGNSIVIGESGSIELKDQNQNSIRMDDQGITLQAGSEKNIIINGTQVLINS